MDTTETYIKMCEKAKKHLPILQPQVGQWWAIKGFKGWEVELVSEGEEWQEPYLRPWADYVCGDDEEYNNLITDSLPIYTQDQLQEMVLDEYKRRDAINLLTTMCFLFNAFTNAPGEMPFASMEQLWLAFVMKEKYNKAWSGTIWTKRG